MQPFSADASSYLCKFSKNVTLVWWVAIYTLINSAVGSETWDSLMLTGNTQGYNMHIQWPTFCTLSIFYVTIANYDALYPDKTYKVSVYYIFSEKWIFLYFQWSKYMDWKFCFVAITAEHHKNVQY